VSIAINPQVSPLPLPASAHRASPIHPTKLVTVSVHLAQPGTVVVAVRGQVDMSSAPHLREHLQRQIHHAGPDLVLDLRQVDFFGCAGLTVLSDVSKTAAFAEIGFRVVACTRAVLIPLRLTGMDAMIDVYPDLDNTPMRPWLPIGRL
jgi:anti-anti-sigma factor